ncbi:hypothetical protein QYE76_050407 [Lolium multiflorum]|uniref:CCHC-type domain-containing protein n=1 Tax=Lolium multiflorum TaxID=4521 RepID=A0AAD8SPV6_LOLMU|nr:hypothetical protein QYE76_050407 [Lolium multiflorum]
MMQMPMLEDRQAERAERQANIAALQQLANNNQGHHDHPGSKLKNFQNTNPPIFNKTEEPLDADDWLQTMENNLEVAGVEATEKTQPSRWKESYIKPTNRSADDEPNGPHHTLKYRNNPGGFTPRHNKPTTQNYRPNYTNNNGGPPKPGGNNTNNHPNNNGNRNNNNHNHPNGTNNHPNTAPVTGSNAVPINPKDKSTVNCYECGVVGHYSNECPKKLAKIAATPLPAQQQRRFVKKEPEQQQRPFLPHDCQ